MTRQFYFGIDAFSIIGIFSIYAPYACFGPCHEGLILDDSERTYIMLLPTL